MSDRDDKGPFHKKPINKATMDQPQEEFIEPYAATVDPDSEQGSEMEHVSHMDRWTERATR